jgi:hypothetical protein
MPYKLVCEDFCQYVCLSYMSYLHSFSGEDLVNMFMICLICICFHMWFNCDSTFFIVFFFNWDFNLNLDVKSINCDLLFLWLVSLNILILKFLKVMKGQSFAIFWTKAFNVLRNIEIIEEYRNQTRMTFMNTYDMNCSSFFYGNCSYYIFKSMLLCFKNVRAFVCCTSLSNRAHYKLKYRNILMYLWIFVCDLTIVFLFPKYVKHVILIGCGHDLYLDNVVVKKLYWRFVY